MISFVLFSSQLAIPTIKESKKAETFVRWSMVMVMVVDLLADHIFNKSKLMENMQTTKKINKEIAREIKKKKEIRIQIQ